MKTDDTDYACAQTLVNACIITPEPEPTATRVKIGRYEVIDRLGFGSMGSVFLAHDPELDRAVAVKLHHQSDVPRLRSRLRREAQAMARIRHANVVKVHDIGVFHGELYIVMEYFEGGTLADWLDTEQPWTEVLRVFEQTGRGLAAAHAAGLVHRDLKPSNILLDHGCVPKLSDFGLVCSSEAPGDSSPRNAFDLTLTRTGTLLGTPAYMAPEQFARKRADARSDQFAFCVALHEALWGPPFAGKTRGERGANVLNNRRLPRAQRDHLPDHLAAVVDRGLAPDSRERWPSVDALLDALQADPEPARSERSWSLGLPGLFRRRPARATGS